MTRLMLVLALLAVGCRADINPSHPASGSIPTRIKLATWNLEWLIAPQAFRSLRGSCVPQGASPAGRQRYIPCDVVAGQERSTADFAALARYAQRLDADVIALQEVDGEAAARLVFRGYQFCFSARTAVQNTGFAIRAGLPFRCGADFLPLSLHDSVRRGTELILFPGTANEWRLLAVHLKSGCGRNALDSPKRECTLLAQQVPVLKQWINAQAAAGRAFAVLGDFNRDLLHDAGPPTGDSGAQPNLFAQLQQGDTPETHLSNAAEGQLFTNCTATQNFNGYIDNILLSRSLAARRVPGGFEHLTYSLPDALQRRLSDHCPAAIQLRVAY